MDLQMSIKSLHGTQKILQKRFNSHLISGISSSASQIIISVQLLEIDHLQTEFIIGRLLLIQEQNMNLR
jgi:hypothetical protein